MQTMKKWLAAMVLGGALLSACAQAAPLPQAKLQLVPPPGVKTAPLTVTAELATDEASREQGLMFRQSLAPEAGMLFTWPSSQVEKFWMRNTYIPLDMLYFNHGQLVDVVAWARPMDESPLGPDVPVDAVLEVNGGWAAAHKVGPGWTLRTNK